MEQTKKQILNYIRISKLFASLKFNKISSLIPDLFNQIHPIDLSGFKINLTSQSIPNT